MTSTRLVRVGVLAVTAVASAGCLQVQKDLPAHVVAARSAARSGGTLTVGILAPTSIDPSLVPGSDSAGSLVVRTMCDSLLATDPATGRLVPDLAAETRVGGDGTLLTIRLRRGLRFSDGRRVTSADVVASLARVARPSVASPNAPLLDEVFGFAQLQQDQDKARDRLAGISAPDPRTVQIALSTADAQWPRILAASVGAILPAATAKKDDGFGAFSTRPVCVGPYRLVAPWKPGDATLTLQRVASYDGGNPRLTRAGRGWVDRIVFHVYATAPAVLSAWRSGAVDVAQLAPSGADADRQSFGGAVVAAPDATIGYIGLPTSVPPFDDPVVRRALSMALDRTAIARDIYGGGRLPLGGLYPAAVGDDVWRPNACGAAAPASGNIAGARQLLGSRISLLRGRSVSLYVDDEFANRELVEAVAAQWHRVFGIAARLVPMPFDSYLQKAVQAPGLDGPFRLSYASPSSSAVDYARDLLSSAALDDTNVTRFTDRTIDQLLRSDAARRAGSLGDAALSDIETEFCRQLPLLPITVNEKVWAWRPTIGAAGGVQLDRATALPLLREAFRRG